ncbi:MAG: phosphotransferase [Bacteroidetes bacterium]|nr:phosphotransferase [Bacteroidota bacterium]
MIKIDFHIHTLSTPSDAAFTFSLKRLKDYVRVRYLDCIAITNHNQFSLKQFEIIKAGIRKLVLPGIEIDLEGGQLLLIADGSDLKDFDEKCQEITKLRPTKKSSITVEQLIQIYGDLAKYILIPHYDKKPQLKEHTLLKLQQFVTAGEVSSVKKFVYWLKGQERLVPVYFSDCRIDENLLTFPVRQTYVACDEASFSAIRSCLRDKSKVSLSESDGSKTFQIFDDGQMLSTSLNVIIGERSSGKSHTLKRICEEFENVKYIKQFSLVERDEKQDEKRFSRFLREEHSLHSRGYLEELQVVINDVLDVDLETDSRSVSEYLRSLKKFANEIEKHDAYSKASLFREEKFAILKQKNIFDLIESTQNLIENVEFREMIEKHVSLDGLKALIVELMLEYSKRELLRLKKVWVNDLVTETKGKLRRKSAATTIEDVDLYGIAMNRNKVVRFERAVQSARVQREIMRKRLQGFEIVASVRDFQGASELKELSRLKSKFSGAFKLYKHPYRYLQELREIDGLEEADLSKYFAKIDYKILNKDGFEVSGGERSEFNLLQEIEDAQRYEMLLIDEPESSFDNLFLKSEVNVIIKDLAEHMPVVLVTHNNTVGASIKPNYLLCTRKELVDEEICYRIYSGFPANKQLRTPDGKSLDNWEVTMGCLEAGEDAYNERRRGYEDLKH